MSSSTATAASDFPSSMLEYYQDVVRMGIDPARTDGLIWDPKLTAPIKTTVVEGVVYLQPDYDFTVGVRSDTTTIPSTMRTKFDIGTAYAITQYMREEAYRLLRDPVTFKNVDDVISTLTKNAVNRAISVEAHTAPIDRAIMNKAHKGTAFRLEDLSLDWLAGRTFQTQQSHISDIKDESVKLNWDKSILEQCYDHPDYK